MIIVLSLYLLKIGNHILIIDTIFEKHTYLRFDYNRKELNRIHSYVF